MRNLVFFFIILMLAACSDEPAVTSLSPEEAVVYFRKIEQACEKDSGRLWGQQLYGPVMFIDRTTRSIIANQGDSNGYLKEKEGIYIGTYPRERIINNTAADFGGTVFAMSPLPPRDDRFDYRMLTRALHSLFHRHQLLNDIAPDIFNISSMDETQARIWIKLEWEALRKAITTGGEEKKLAIRDALIFRGSNREAYPRESQTQNRFETYEGLATFTYIKLASDSREEFLERLFAYLDNIMGYQSYARSYGFIHGALYATLLEDMGYDFSILKTDNTDLGQLVKDLYGIELPEVCRDVAGSLAFNYDIDRIKEEEEQRAVDIKERLYKQVSIYTEKPVVFFELESPYFDFEPEDVHSLDTIGTLYTSMRVSDNWGKLTVDKGGCLVSYNYKNMRITAKGLKEDRNHVTGEGWHLILNSDWELISVNQNYFIRKFIP